MHALEATMIIAAPWSGIDDRHPCDCRACRPSERSFPNRRIPTDDGEPGLVTLSEEAHVGNGGKELVDDNAGPVKLIDIDQLPDDALVVPVCMMGAPTVMTEKLPQGDERINAFRALEKLLSRKIDAVLCGEAGGVNSTTPFVVASMAGLPLVDGDGMGRAYPELQMVTFSMHGVSATPMVLLAFYSMSGATAKKAIVRGTLTLCAALGQTLREAKAAHVDPVTAIVDKLQAKVIFHGRVIQNKQPI